MKISRLYTPNDQRAFYTEAVRTVGVSRRTSDSIERDLPVEKLAL
jgi:DNA-binding XRE family transcriptional regulator